MKEGVFAAIDYAWCEVLDEDDDISRGITSPSSILIHINQQSLPYTHISHLLVVESKERRRCLIATTTMGKKNNKLKSSLERHKTNQAIKQQQKVQEKKKEKEKVSTKPDKLPFRPDDYVLLVGEGELDSFTNA